MKHYNYDNKFFHADLFMNDNCICDNEIANDISPDWDYLKGIPIVVGFLHKDKMDIFLADSEDDKDFAEAVQEYMTLKRADGISIYAFNRKMEQGNFKGAWNIDYEFKEIKPFNAKSWGKDRFYNELVARQVIPDCQVSDVFSGDASLCIRNWKKYQDTGQVEYALEIVKHNMNCLLKESVIQKNKAFFLRNFKINERGWLEE